MTNKNEMTSGERARAMLDGGASEEHRETMRALTDPEVRAARQRAIESTMPALPGDEGASAEVDEWEARAEAEYERIAAGLSEPIPLPEASLYYATKRGELMMQDAAVLAVLVAENVSDRSARGRELRAERQGIDSQIEDLDHAWLTRLQREHESAAPTVEG